MKTVLSATLICGAFLTGAFAAGDSEKKVKMQNLPPAVQQAVKEHSQGATLRGLAKEVENGKTLYEAELITGGHSKDITFDPEGKVVSVEEEVALGSIPTGAREALQKSKGKLLKLESVTENGVTAYEGHFRKGLKTSELKVDSNGNPVK